MGKAAELLSRNAEVRGGGKKAGNIEIDGRSMVEMPLYGRRAELRAVARLYRIIRSKHKALTTELDSVKEVIRAAAQDELDASVESGRYAGAADVCGVRVSRANKFSAVQYGRDEMIEAVGETNYRIMFNESGCIKFGSVDDLRAHINMCNEVGVVVCGEVEEKVTGNSKLVEYIARAGRTLDADTRELLVVCAKDQKARVS